MRPLAVVTGASAGLGAVFARQLTARGYDLVLTARRADRLNALATELGRNGAACQVVAADLSEDSGIEAVADVIQTRRPDLLVNNAGFGTKGRFHEADFAGQHTMHRVHVMATLRLTHAALGPMVERGSGGIINVSSVAGFARSPGNVSYCATKSWMNAFTEALVLEMRALQSPVRIQALCPGFTYTEFHDVMQVSRDRVPRTLWLDADFVVGESLRALDRGQWLVIPDWRYRWFVALITRLPARLRLAMQSRSPHSRA